LFFLLWVPRFCAVQSLLSQLQMMQWCDPPSCWTVQSMNLHFIPTIRTILVPMLSPWSMQMERHQGTDNIGGWKFIFPPQTPEWDSESLETILEVLGSAAASETVNKYIKNMTSKIYIKPLPSAPPLLPHVPDSSSESPLGFHYRSQVMMNYMWNWSQNNEKCP
jgi:hypothetical protein